MNPRYPLSNHSRKKTRRWPLVLRVIKGAVHGEIIVPVFLHACFTLAVVLLDRYVGNVSLPSVFTPSLSIVVGLMLVFRNSSSYDRFWSGRNHIGTITNAIRNLTRCFLTSCTSSASPEERADTARTVRILVAIVFAVKSHLREEWGSLTSSSRATDLSSSEATLGSDYASSLLPDDVRGFEEDGLGMPLQLSVLVEAYIRRGVQRGWFNAPQASQLTAQVNALVDAYGRCEMIGSTPIPVAHLIHLKQVLALFNCVLPFAMVDELGFWTIPIVALISFTLYGIENIGSQLENPFGTDKNDIRLDAIAEDTRQEISVLLEQWKDGGSMFK